MEVNEIYALSSTLTESQRKLIALARCLRGASALDKHNRGNWRQSLRENGYLFDISNGEACVLGIRFGDFDAGMYQLQLNKENLDSVQHGFEADVIVSYRILQEVWRELIGITEEFDSEASEYDGMRRYGFTGWGESHVESLLGIGMSNYSEDPEQIYERVLSRARDSAALREARYARKAEATDE